MNNIKQIHGLPQRESQAGLYLTRLPKLLNSLNWDTDKLQLSPQCVPSCAQSRTTSMNPSIVNYGREQGLWGMPRLPFENVDFTQVVVDRRSRLSTG